MDSTLTLKSNSFKFNYFHLLILIGLTASVFILTHVLTVKHVVETATVFTFEDAEGLMEEVYNSGTITEALKNLPLDAAIVKKMCEEIAQQLAKTIDHQGCEVYKLVALQNSEYPVLGYGDVIFGFEYLKKGEVWKIGMTCNGEEGRYSGDKFYKSKDGAVEMTKDMLRYQPVFKGTYKQAIILEKILIYTYPLWSGHPEYLKPFGNKIFR